MFDEKLTQMITDIVQEYSRSGIYLDDKALKNITGLFCINFNLNEYIKGFQYTDYFSGKNDSRENSYDFNSGVIFFNYGKTLDRARRQAFVSKNAYDMYEETLEINLYILRELIENICTAYCYRVSDERNKYLDKVLCVASFEDHILPGMRTINEEGKKTYISLLNIFNNSPSLYISSPAKRMGKITAFRYSNIIAADRKLKLSRDVKHHERRMLLKHSLAGYNLSEENSSPTVAYFKNRATLLEAASFSNPLYDISTVLCTLKDESERLPLEDKLYYGLRLNDKERKQLTKKIK